MKELTNYTARRQIFEVENKITMGIMGVWGENGIIVKIRNRSSVP